MADPLNICVVGLGVMGQRMIEQLRAHPRLRATVVWDANPDILARTLELHPAMRSARTVEAAIASAGLHCAYIATPPAAHLRLSMAAFDAGLSVLCEKPLSVDFDAARRVIRRIADEKLRAAVNFSLASSAALAFLQQQFGAGSALPMGAVRKVAIDVGFAAWPRPWQAAAGSWLSERAEGGFAREVLSHFIFVLQRVLGPATVWGGKVVYPSGGHGSETALQAELRIDEVAVRVRGRVDPAVGVADNNRMLWQADSGAVALRDWFGLTYRQSGQAEASLGQTEALRAAGRLAQMDQWVALIEGRSHLLPGFGEALAVQETIEAILRAA